MAIGVFRIARPSTTRATLLTVLKLVNTVCEVVELPWIAGKSLHDSFSGATVYEAVAA